MDGIKVKKINKIKQMLYGLQDAFDVDIEEKGSKDRINKLPLLQIHIVTYKK